MDYANYKKNLNKNKNKNTKRVSKSLTPKKFKQNISNYDYIEALKYFKNVYSSDLYEKLLNKILNYNGSLLYLKNNTLRNEVLLKYLYLLKNITGIVIWPISKIDNLESNSFFIRELNKYGVIHGIKEIDLTKHEAINFIYQLYYGNKYFNNNNKFTKKLNKSKIDSNLNKIYIIFYETNQRINGMNAPFKSHLRKTIIKNKHLDVHSNLVIHATDNFNETIELAKMVLNKNSLKFLENMNVASHMKNINLCESLKKIKKITNNFNLKDRDNILVSINKDSSIIVYQNEIFDNSFTINNKIDYYNLDNFYYYIGLKIGYQSN